MESMFTTRGKDSEPCEETQVLSDDEIPCTTGSQEATEQADQAEQTMENTQAVLAKPKKMIMKKKASAAAAGSKGKGNADTASHLSAAKKIRTVKQSQLYSWLKAYWHSQLMVVVMNEFLANVRKYALEKNRSDIYKVTQALTKIMKEFILYLQEKELIRVGHSMTVSFETFDAWVLKDGLSMMYTSLQETDSVSDLDDIFFSLFSMTVMELEEQLADQGEESCLSPNMKHTSMLSTTVLTHPTPADAAASNTLKTTNKKKAVLSKKEVSTSSAERVDSNKKPRNLKRKLPVSESESEEEEVRKATTKKVNFKMDSESDSQSGDEKAFNCLLDDIVQAASLTRGTSRISSNICCQDSDEFITLKSPGQYGKWVMKFDIYPYKYCARHAKNTWWQEATMRSMVVVSGKDPPVGRLMEKMKRAIIEQVKDTEGTEVERKPRGSKGGYRNS